MNESYVQRLCPILSALNTWLFAAVVAHASTSVSPTGYSGAPPESQSCSACHSGSSGSGSVSLSFPAGFQKYEAGKTYALSVTVSDATKSNFGFSMVARNNANQTVNAGTLAAGDANTTVGSSHASHSGAPTVAGGSRTFSVNWTAPPSAGVGQVIFYLSTVAGDSAGSSGGDFVYDQTVVIDEAIPVNPIVSSTADSGAGSLRNAVSIAAPGDTITFSPTLNGGKITLSGTQIFLDKNLIIDASALGNGLIISGNNASRVFGIASSTSVNLHSLAIIGGRSNGGGGIDNAGTLVIDNCTIESNSVASGQGGGIRNFGTLDIRNSTIANNTASGNGGGIHNSGASANATLSNTSLFNNTSQANGGGGFNNTSSATATFTHVTITANTATGSSGGGILRSSGSVSVNNSIITGNVATTNPNLSGTISQSGANLTTGDALLGPLCDNGGSTRTMLPLPGSRAVNAGGSTALTLDQRGFPRNVGSAPDIGAVETSSNVFWATSVLGFSTQYTTTNWSAAQALGIPNVFPSFGDNVRAWSSLTGDSQREFLELGFENFAPINAVSVYETLAPGAVDGISVRNAISAQWVQVWTGTAAPAGNTARIFTATFPMTSFPVDAVRIEINSPAVLGYNEIDAVSITPAAAATQEPGLATAFTTRSILTNNVSSGGKQYPAPVSTTSNGSATVWQWTPQSDGWYDINTFGSNFDTKISVYEGTAANSLVWLAGNDDAFPGEFATDHPQSNRSAMVLPFTAGTTYQFVISGGANGASGGSLLWTILPVSEPLPPAVETRTHPFNFPPSEYNAATALINTIVPIIPIAGFGTPEPYVQVVDTRSAVWKTVSNGDVTANPYLGVGAILRSSNAHKLSSQPRLSAVVSGGFVNPPSAKGPFITVVSARYPHRFGAGHQAICTDLRAEGGQGFGLTQMPKIHFGNQSSGISAVQGGLKVAFQGLPVGLNTFGYTLKDSSNNPVRNSQGTAAEQLVSLSPGSYSMSLNEVEGYRIVVSYEGDGSIAQRIANVVEEGNQLVNARRNICSIFPNSVDCSHLGVPNFITQPVLAVSELVVKADTVTILTVKYVPLTDGTDKIGYINVPAPEFAFLQQEDVLGETGNPMLESAVLNLSNAAQTKVLVMIPEDASPVGRVVRWQKSSNWIKFRNFITSGDTSCYACHFHRFSLDGEDLRGQVDPVDSLVKVAGGRPRVPWYRTDPSIPKTAPFVTRIVPADTSPSVLGIVDRPFGKPLGHRMPIDIEANTGPARRTTVIYAKRTWIIQQAAGSGTFPSIAINGGNQITLTPGTQKQTVSFSASNSWTAAALDSPWIHFTGPASGAASGNTSLSLSFDPNPSARPRFGTVQIGDVFFTLVQPIEPPEITSLLPLASPKGFRYSLKAINGVTYNLEYSDTLAPGSWVEQTESVAVRETSTLSFDAVFPALPTKGFYRIKSKPAQ